MPFSSITSHCIAIDAAPTSYKINPEDGSKQPMYTFPVIHDPATGATVSDSFNIARYLDKMYPSHADGITFVPAGTAALQLAFETAFTGKVIMTVLPLLALDIGKAFAVEDYECWRSTRQEKMGLTVEGIAPVSEEAKAEAWKKALAGFAVVGGWLAANDGEGQKFVLGEKMSWTDLLIGNWLLMMRRMWGEKDERWQEVMALEGGRWKRCFELIVKYEYVDEAGLLALNF